MNPDIVQTRLDFINSILSGQNLTNEGFLVRFFTLIDSMISIQYFGEIEEAKSFTEIEYTKIEYQAFLNATPDTNLAAITKPRELTRPLWYYYNDKGRLWWTRGIG